MANSFYNAWLTFFLSVILFLLYSDFLWSETKKKSPRELYWVGGRERARWGIVLRDGEKMACIQIENDGEIESIGWKLKKGQSCSSSSLWIQVLVLHLWINGHTSDKHMSHLASGNSSWDLNENNIAGSVSVKCIFSVLWLCHKRYVLMRNLGGVNTEHWLNVSLWMQTVCLDFWSQPWSLYAQKFINFYPFYVIFLSSRLFFEKIVLLVNWNE